MEPEAEIDRLQAAGSEAPRVLAEIFEAHRPRLERMVRFRMDPKLRTRLGASDVLQDAFVEASQRLGTYMQSPDMPLFLWLRFLTAQRLLMLRRRHLVAQKRDVRRQVPLRATPYPDASSVVLADALVARDPSPSRVLKGDEARQELEAALESMRPMDREVLVLRHFEGLTNAEVAEELRIERKAASKRYLRALERIRDVLGEDEPEVS